MKPGYDVEAYKERKRQEIKEISEQLEIGVRELITSERYKEFLGAMSKFHRYSLNNSLLIALQHPDASQVASFQTWQKLGRHVNRGETGIKVLVPTPIKIRKEDKRHADETEPEADKQIMRYKVGYVFDISQTDGVPLPTLGVEELTGSYDGYERFMEAVQETSPVPVRFADIQGGAKGYFDRNAGEVILNTGMSEAQTMKTAVHEVTHATLHSKEVVNARESCVDRRTMEVEAESVAFIVSQHFGLDTSDYSFGYITSWSSDKDLKELKNSMEIIRSTAGELIDGIYERIRERETVMERAEKDIAIYQVTDDVPVHLRFQSMEDLHGMGLRPEHLPYNCVYQGPVAENATLDDIYTKFNVAHPEGYNGYSVSVGDVIIVQDKDDNQRGYFVDNFGFTELIPEQVQTITAEKNREKERAETKDRRKAK